LSRNPATAGIKHLGRLEQVLARVEWSDPEIAEGVMLDTEDRVIEGTMTNLFVVGDHGIATPDLSQSGVAGTMRALVIDLGRELGIPVAVRELHWTDLDRARGIFMTSALAGIWPVCELEGRPVDPRAVPDGLILGVRQRGLAP
jgi:4-amino-4-deoxychorismate lyase